LLALSGCGSSFARYPGPLGPVGRAASERQTPVAPETGPDEPVWRGPGDPFARDIVRAAEHYLRHKPDHHRDDCSGFVCAVFERAGVPLQGNTRLLWEQADSAGALHRRKIPSVGDIVFFDNTYDRNDNRAFDDDLTHVAVVLSVDDEGTIVMAQGGSGHGTGRNLLRMNLRDPSARYAEDERVLNDYLRVRRSSDPARARYLAGELWRGFATVRPRDTDVWLAEAGS
jgi:hypothetical protein